MVLGVTWSLHPKTLSPEGLTCCTGHEDVTDEVVFGATEDTQAEKLDMTLTTVF